MVQRNEKEEKSKEEVETTNEPPMRPDYLDMILGELMHIRIQFDKFLENQEK